MPTLYDILAKTDQAETLATAQLDANEAEFQAATGLPPMFATLVPDQLQLAHLAVKLMQQPESGYDIVGRTERKNTLAKKLRAKLGRDYKAKTVDGYTPESYINILSRSRNLILQGNAGTGKTTTISSVLSYIAYYAPHVLETVAYICPTGAAASRSKALLSEAGEKLKELKGLDPALTAQAVAALGNLGTETIHAYLKFAPTDCETGKLNEYGEPETVQIFKPRFNELRLVPCIRIVIVEEMSMLGLKLNYQLQSAHSSEVLFIYIGDINQTSTVADTPAAVRIMYTAPECDLAVLDKVHRYSGHILAQATGIIKGLSPKPDGKTLIEYPLPVDGDAARIKIVDAITKLHSMGKYDPVQDQLIVTTNIGPLGQIELNRALATAINPHALDEYALVNQGYGREEWFYLGAKLIFTKNEPKNGVVNGTVCQLDSIQPNPKYVGKASTRVLGKNAQEPYASVNPLDQLDPFAFDENDDGINDAFAPKSEEPETRQATHILTVSYLDAQTGAARTLELQTCAQVSGLIYGYACTHYKAQGSEYRNVFVVVHHAMAGLNREFLYTAFTRVHGGTLLLFKEPSHITMAKTLKRQSLRGDTIREKVNNSCGITFSLANI